MVPKEKRPGSLCALNSTTSAKPWIGKSSAEYDQASVDMLASVVSFMVMEAMVRGDQFATIGRADVRSWLGTIVKSFEAQEPDEEEGDKRKSEWAKIHLLFGQSALGNGEFDFVRQETTKAIALARELSDQSILMASLGFYTTAASAQQKVNQKSAKVAKEVVVLANKLGSLYYKSMGLNALAVYEMQRGNEETALAYLADAAKGGGSLALCLPCKLG